MKRRYSKLYKKGVSLLVTAASVCTLMTGCGQTEESEQTMSEVIPVQVQQPEAGSLTIKNEFVGTISPEESVYVIPMVSAEVLSANVSVGDVVSAGDILCELDSEAAELQLASAQVQYESAAAGVNAAQVGYEMAQSQYEIAQSQYESTEAQLDAQLGGQKNLQMYQLQIQVDEIHAGIDDIYKQIDDLEEDRKDAQDKKDDLKGIRNDANDFLEQAGAYLTQAQQAKTAIDMMTWDQQVEMFKEIYKEKYGDDYPGTIQPGDSLVSAAYEEVKKEAQSALDSAQSAYTQASTAASQASAAYEQAKAGVEAIEDGQEQLDGALEDAYRGLQQAEAIKNITEEQIYKDTQKVVDANKKTAALGVDSAALGIDSAAASVNSAQIGVAGAQVAIDSAEYQLDMYTLKAPIDGVIEAVNVDEHAFATPTSPAFVISNKDTMMVTFYVSEGIRNTLNIGQKVGVDRNGKLFDAAITEIGSMIDQTTGLFAIKACVSAPDESLLTGCSVKITADTYSQDNALLIPYDAVYYDDSQSYVYVAVGDTVERKNIETGIFDEQTITVLSGLTTDDQLITSWSANLREGALISIQASQDSAAPGAVDSEE